MANSNRCTSSIPCARATCRSARRSRGARVLDVGCGGGLLAESLARAGAQVTAIDLAPSMIETARTARARFGTAASTIASESAESLLNAHAGKFDVVTCMEMLEHVPDPAAIDRGARQARAAWWRSCSSPPSIAISSPSRWPSSAPNTSRDLVPRGTHEYERLLKPSEIARFARAAGARRRRHRRARLRPAARAVLAHARPVGELPHAPQAHGPGRARHERSHQRRVVRSRRHAARHRARHDRSAERAARARKASRRCPSKRCAARSRTAATRWCGSDSARCRPSEHEAMRMRLLNIYRRQLAKHTRLFEGGDEMLADLERRGLAWGIVTNKPGWLTDPLLVEVGSAHARTRRGQRRHAGGAQAASRCRCCTRPQTMGVEPARMRVRRRRRARHAGRAGRGHVRAGRGLRLSRRRRSRRRLVLAWLAATRRSTCSTGWTSRRAPRKTTGPHELRAGSSRPSPHWPRRSSAICSARCARRGAPRTLRVELEATRARLTLRKRTARAHRRAARAERGAGARRRRKRLARWRSMPTAKPSSSWRAKCSAATRPTRQRLAQGTRRRHHATGRADQGRRCASRKSRRRASSASSANPRGKITGQIESLVNVQALLQRETRNLSTALRRPEVRGRWGELTLRRVVELAGHVRTLRFHRAGHRSTTGERGALRPDLLVRMPESRSIVVDAKTPLDAYMDAVEAQDDEARRAALARHASRWNSACASSARRATGSSSSTARNSRCCSCRAISSCRRRWPSVPT